MKMRFAAVICSTLTGLMILSSQTVAQQKTIKACQEEWRANKAANQANGITEKSYVEQCRAGGAPSQPIAAPAPSITSPPTPGASTRPSRSSQTVAQQKTIKACQEEWRANKAANQANGITEKSYVEQCRAGGAPSQPIAAPAAPPPARTAAPTATPLAPAAPGPAPAATAPTIRRTPSPAAGPAAPPPSTPAGTNQFATEAQAKAHCPSGTVVWANLKSHIYHFSESRNYGSTKDGAYMCEGDTVAAGFRAPKNEVHP
jgi:ketosteroid isomerase-like protein